MSDRTRSAPAAFGRGISQVAANPAVLLAPLGFGIGVAAVAAGVVLFVLGGAGVLARRAAAFRRGPAGFADALDDLVGAFAASPVVVLAGLVVLLVVLLALTALAAWLRAGVTGTLAQADARAPEGASLDAFRHPAVGDAFFGSARAGFWPFFALVNVYGLFATVVAAALVVPMVALFVAVASGRGGLAIVVGLFLLVAVPVAIVGGAAARAVYLAAGRAVSVEGLDGLAAVARGITLVKEAPGRAATLYLLTIAGGMAVGLAFVFPRLAVTFAAGAMHAGIWAVVGPSVFFVVLQMAATLAYDAAVTGSFVALWPQEPAAPAPEPPEASPA